MQLTLLVALLCGVQSQILHTDVSLQKGQSWSRDFILAPGDSLAATAVYTRSVGSSCGCLAGIGDIFYQKGDDVGRFSLSEWNGDELASSMHQQRSELGWYSERGGAYTLALQNSSGHRTNIYALVATRSATASKYASFDATFRTDTTYDTSWVDQPVYRTQVETTIVNHKWTDTLYDLKPLGIKQGVTTLYRGILGSDRSEVNFCLPDNCTGTVGFALFTDRDRLRQLQDEARAKSQVLSSATQLMGEYGAAAAVAMNIVSGVANSGDGAFSYWVVDVDGRNNYNARQAFNVYDKGEKMSDALFSCSLQPGGVYYLELYNPSLLDKSVVAYQIASTVKEPRFVRHSENVPEVKSHKVQTGTRKVPRVSETVLPHLPWKTKGRER